MAYKKKLKKKILLIRFSSFGDVILLHPVIKKLYDNNYEVHILTKKIYGEIFNNNPYIKKLILLSSQKKFLSIIREIHKNRYYKIIDLHKNLRSFIIRIFFFNKIIVYKKYKFKRFLLVKFKINLLKNNSVVSNYLKTLKRLGISLNNKDYNYKIDTMPEKIKYKKYIVVAPFAKWKTKIWSNYNDLINLLSKKYKIIIVGDEKESKYARLYDKNNIINLCGKLNFNSLVEIIKKSLLLISNDTAIMHIGAGTNVNQIAIFTSTVREFGFVPVKKNFILIENKNVKCRPCSYHGLNQCPLHHFNCSKKISVELVLKYVKKFVKI